jgi:hypothetical protein
MPNQKLFLAPLVMTMACRFDRKPHTKQDRVRPNRAETRRVLISFAAAHALRPRVTKVRPILTRARRAAVVIRRRSRYEDA